MTKRFSSLVLAGFALAGFAAAQTPFVWAQTSGAQGQNAQNAGDTDSADFGPLRPSFGSRLNHLDGILKGKITVRVVGYAPNAARARFPILGRSNKVAQIRLDNEPIDEPFTVMPHELSWDTAQFADGTHVLAIMLLDTETRDTQTLDKVIVTLNNGRPVAVAPVPGSDAATSDKRRPSLPPPPAPNARTRRGSDDAPLVLDASQPGKAQIVSFEVNEDKSERPLSATASVLCQANGFLYLGLKDGGIAACNLKTLTGWVVRPVAFPGVTGANEPVKSLCVDKNAVYWTTGLQNANGGANVFRWDTKTHKATAFVLNSPAPNKVALSVSGRKISLADASRRSDLVQIVDTQSGQVEAERRSQDEDATAVLASETGEAEFQRAYFAPRYSAEQIACIGCAGGRSAARWRQIGPDIIAQLDEKGAGATAYLPWNGAAKDGAIVASVSDNDGVWLATAKGGVRHITPDKPDLETGYDGYVRVRLSEAPDAALSAEPGSMERSEKMAALIDEWQGTPYLWGGTTKKGCDCSGFVSQVHHALGLDIPRSSDQMRASKQGSRVVDELHYGDVLVFPGHVALYIGNGQTAETVGGTGVGSVGKSTIWRRREVAVRRYFP